MKQYVGLLRERKQKRFRFPVDFHLKQAVGALTLHTGVGTLWVYSKAMDIKNARSKVLASHRRLFQMEVIANVCFCFEMAKEKAETFWVSAFVISVILTIQYSKRTTKDIYLLSCGDKKNSFS